MIAADLLIQPLCLDAAKRGKVFQLQGAHCIKTRAQTVCHRARQHHRQSLRHPRLSNAVQPRQLLAQHLLVKKQQSTLRLILRRFNHITLADEVALNPINISLFGADGIVPDADAVAHLIEQAARLWAGCRFTKQWRDGFHVFSDA